MLTIKTFTGIFVLVLFTTFTSSQIAPLPGWSSCATGLNPATGVSIGVSNCTSAPCTFVKGEPYTFTVYARSAVNTNSVPFSVTATFPGIGTVNFLNGDGCDVMLMGKCPIVNGNIYLADLTYHVDASAPTGYAVIQITVTDGSNDVIICAQFFAIVAN